MTKDAKKKEVEVAKKFDVDMPGAKISTPEYDSNLGMEDLILPRVELMQAMSPAVSLGDAVAGALINNITKDDLGSPNIVPIYLTKNWIRWRKREEGGGMVWRSSDPNDERVINESAWGADGAKPLATAYLNFLCLVDGEDMPIIVSFCNTSYKAGRKLFTLTKMSPGSLYDCQYKLSSKTQTNNKGTFYVYEVARVGPSTDEQREQARSFGKMFAGTELNFEAETEAAKPSTGDLGDEF